MNSVHFVGRLTKNPELSKSNSQGTPYCRFSLGIDRGRDKDGADLGADFPSVTAFGRTAENICKYCEQGQLIEVEGKVRTGKYQRDGKTVYTETVFADRVRFLARSQASRREYGPEADEAAAYDKMCLEPAPEEIADEALPF